MVRRANYTASEKFEALLKFLDKSAADVARATGLGESYFSKVRKSGEGGRGIGADAARKIEETLRIDRRYWDDGSPCDPAAFKMKAGVRAAPTDAELAGAMNQARMLEIARRHGATDTALLGLVRAEPTPEQAGDPWWWFGLFVDLTKAPAKR